MRNLNFSKKKGPIYIFGDFNARTATEHDIIEQDKFDINFGMQNQKRMIKRNSLDEILTSRGKELIDICKINDIAIVNGRKIGDIFGKFTCHVWHGSSQIDYMLTPCDSFDNVICFEVGPFLPWLSDHCPVLTTISTIIDKGKQDTSDKGLFDEILSKYIWRSDSEMYFKKNLDSESIKDKIKALEADEQINPVQLAKEIKDLLLNIAKECNIMSNNKRKINKNNKPWFDKECGEKRMN